MPVDGITSVALGQPATVRLDGADAPLTGEVASISVAPDAASTTTAYRVVIALDGAPDLRSGATGSVEIVTTSTAAALAVPTSAVTTDGTSTPCASSPTTARRPSPWGSA